MKYETTIKGLIITKKIKVEPEDLRNLFFTALEGGSNYWYCFPYDIDELKMEDNPEITCLTNSEYLFELIWQQEKSIEVNDVEDSSVKLGRITKESMIKAVKLLQEINLEQFESLLEDQWDAETADLWFQLAVMGEVVYG